MPAGPDGRRKTSRLPPVLPLSVAKEKKDLLATDAHRQMLCRKGDVGAESSWRKGLIVR
jgi:hypothetical protein